MKMTKIVLKEGYWCNDNVKAYICVCKDNQLVWKNMVCLDYPDVPASFKVDLEIGEFGPASEEIKEATGTDGPFHAFFPRYSSHLFLSVRTEFDEKLL